MAADAAPASARLPRECGRLWCYCNDSSTPPDFPTKSGRLANEARRDPESAPNSGKSCRKTGRYYDRAEEYSFAKVPGSAAEYGDMPKDESQRELYESARPNELPSCAVPPPARRPSTAAPWRGERL